MELVQEGVDAGHGDVAGVPPVLPPPAAPRPNLRDVAMTLEHMLNHKPANPNCDACLRGKMRDSRKLVGSFAAHRRPTKFLELVTCDHI
eukprot:6508075-Heterocapsa_arctica.AAC.1